MEVKLRVSPSQISAFRGCQRRWYLRSVLGLPEPSSPSAELGLDVHAAIERRLAERWSIAAPVSDRSPNEHAEVLAARALAAADDLGLLSRRPMIECGVQWTPQELAGVATLSGRVDVYLPPTLHDDAVVVDWKTRSSLSYAPDGTALLLDPQLVVYASAALEEQGGAGAVKFCHVNVATRSNDASVVAVTVDADQLRVGQQAVVGDVLAMADLAGQPVEAARPTFTHCQAYGGCPHRTWCSERADWPHAGGYMDTSTLTARLQARRTINPPDGDPVAAAARQATPAEPVPVAAPVQPPVPATDATAARRRILLLGCAPLVGVDGAVWADRWLAPLADEVAQRNGVAHFSLVEYGRGKAELVGMVAALVRAGEIPRTLVLDRRTALGEAVVDVLSPAYDIVIGRLG